MFERPTKPIAAVITEWRTNSHADVILSRILEPAAWGHARPFDLKLVSVYADQFPARDLCRSTCARNGVPIFDDIRGAVGVGTSGVPVEGVLLIGEHGDYPRDAIGRQLYPRARLFRGIVDAFRTLGRRVPVFSDKHLSYDWGFARMMVEIARHEGFPLLAGSSVPVAWRFPEFALPMGTALRRALSVGYSDLDAYGFHALEALQCMTERRAGGETGVATVRSLSDAQVWSPAGRKLWEAELLDAIEPHRKALDPAAPAVRQRKGDAVFVIEYRDGLKAACAMLNSVGRCFAYAGERADGKTDATIFDLEGQRPYGHFGHLTRAIERLIHDGKAPYPVERTLLTGGILEASLRSRAEGGSVIRTPHLEAVRYTPADYPFAPGKSGTPA